MIHCVALPSFDLLVSSFGVADTTWVGERGRGEKSESEGFEECCECILTFSITSFCSRYRAKKELHSDMQHSPCLFHCWH